MACSGCEKRREAIRATAKSAAAFVGKAFQRLGIAPGTVDPPVVKPNAEDAGRKAIRQSRKISAR